MPPPTPQHATQPKFTVHTSEPKAISSKVASQDDTASLAQRSVVPIELAKTPHRAGLARARASPIIQPLGRGRSSSLQSKAQNTPAEFKWPKTNVGCKTPLSSASVPESEEKSTTPVILSSPPTRVRSADLSRSYLSTVGRAASLSSALAAGPKDEGFCSGSPATRRFVGSPPLALAQGSRHTDPSAETSPRLCSSDGAVLSDPQGTVVSTGFSRDASSSNATSPVLHRTCSVSCAATKPHASDSFDLAATTVPPEWGYKDAKGCATAQQISAITTSTSPRTRDSSEELATLDKPWLATPPARSILKRKGGVRAAVIRAVSRHSSTRFSRSPHGVDTSAGGMKTRARGTSIKFLADFENVSAGEPARPARHVTFDEDLVTYRDNSTSESDDDDSRSGMPLELVRRGSVLRTSFSEGVLEGAVPPLGTAGSLGTNDAENWGADSAWFNKEFWAQLKQPAAASEAWATISTSSWISAANESRSPTLGSLTTRSRKALLPLSRVSSSSPLTLSTKVSGVSRSTPRGYGMKWLSREKSSTGSYETLGAPVFTARSDAPISTPVVMSPHLASVLSGAASPASGRRVIASGANRSAGDEESDSAPVLEHYSSPQIVVPHSNQYGVVTSRQSGANTVPPPLSVSDLRRRSSAALASSAMSAVISGSGGPGRSRHGSSRLRSSSRSRSFS